MRKKYLFLLLIIATIFSFSFNDIRAQDKEIPPHAKWGQLAVKETMQKYPDADVVDYLHRGRTHQNGITTEHFKLWLKNEKREFGVYVDIKFKTDTEKTISISFKETDQ